jgi:error-prone DNA polymerase
VHYGTEFLASLLDEQPMGFYPPDALVHEAQRRGIAVLAPDVNASAAGCTVVDVDDEGTPGVRIGLGYVVGVREDDVAALVAAREAAGPFRSIEDLASRAGAGRGALEQLAWSGACDALTDGSRRRALWELGVAAPGRRLLTSVVGASGRRVRADMGTQLALPLGVGQAPALPGLSGWEAMIADYTTTGLTTAQHPLGLLRDELRAQRMITSADMERVRHGTPVKVAGLVVARQRPGTAKGVVFMLLEDEAGTINLIVPPNVYERDRTIVRAEPLVVAEGVLERHASGGGAINIVCKRIARLDASGRLQATPAADVGVHHVTAVTGGGADRLAGDVIQVKDFSMLDAIELARQDARRAAEESGDDLAATGTDDFRAVAPAVQSFAAGRRR